MKKLLSFVVVAFCIASFVTAEDAPGDSAAQPAQGQPAKVKTSKVKRKRVIKSSSAAPQAPKSSAKLEDTPQANKPHLRESFQSWLKDLKKRVNRSKTQPHRLVSVAAVRGDETPDSPPLYWKGKKAQGPVNAPELKDFETAVDTALTGDPMAAKEKLQSFILAYPKSPLVSDAKETLSRLETASANP